MNLNYTQMRIQHKLLLDQLQVISAHDRPQFEIDAMAHRALRKDELPSKYKDLPILGRGATSIVCAKDEHTVLMFTRDQIKKDWLTHELLGLGIGRVLDTYQGHLIRDFELRALDIYVIELPRLYKLQGSNVTRVKRQLDLIDTIAIKIRTKHQFSRIRDKNLFNIDLWNYYTKHYPNGMLQRFLEFAANCEATQFSFDLRLANFLQDADGHIVVTDPVVSEELYSYIQSGSSHGRS